MRRDSIQVRLYHIGMRGRELPDDPSRTWMRGEYRIMTKAEVREHKAIWDARP